MNIKGKLISCTVEVYGNENKEKATVVIETQDQYPKKICFQKFLKDNTTNFYKSLKVGTIIDVHFNPESREFNGKWFTNLNIWKIDLGSEKTVQNPNPQPQQQEADSDLPF